MWPYQRSHPSLQEAGSQLLREVYSQRDLSAKKMPFDGVAFSEDQILNSMSGLPWLSPMDFLSPVAKTRSSQCRGPWFDPWGSGN